MKQTAFALLLFGSTIVIPPPHPFGFNPRMGYFGELFVRFPQPRGLRQPPKSTFDPQVFHEESYASRMTLEITTLVVEGK